MGVVIKQSGYSSLFTYIGTLIGFVNILILYPAFLNTEQIGLMRAIPSAAFMIMPLVQLGAPRTLVKFSPELNKSDNGLAQLTGSLLILIGIGFVIVLGLLLSVDTLITGWFENKAPLFNEYFGVMAILIFVLSIYTFLESYSKVLLKTIGLNIIKEILVRVLFSIVVSLYFLRFITFDQLIYGIIIIYMTALLALVSYLVSIGKFSVSFPGKTIWNRDLLRRTSVYSFYGLIGSGGGYIILNIDQVMITSMLGLSENGVYVTASYFAFMIELSRRAISQITTPLVSIHFEKGNLEEIKHIYQKTSINQLIIGMLIFIGITVNVENVFELMPNGENFKAGVAIVYIIGLAKLIDMGFANNGEIISMSDHYKFNLIGQFILAGMMIGFNIILIPKFGIQGAAYATLFAILLFNLVKMIFVKTKFGFLPFTSRTALALMIGLVTWLIGYFFIKLDGNLVDIIVRSCVVAVIYGLLVYFTKVSSEISSLIQSFISRIIK